MHFSVTHNRAPIGQNISVSVAADGSETISSVDVELDGFTLDDYEAPPGTQSYEKDFNGVGDASPGQDHTLTVSAEDQNGNPHSSATQWTDAM